MGKQTLWNIGEDLDAFDALLDEAAGDVTETEEIINRWFAELSGNLEEKVDNYLAYSKKLEAVAKARKEEADRLTALARTDANKAKALKHRLKEFLEARGEKKFETARFKMTVSKNGGKQPLAFDEAAMDEAFFDKVPVLNRGRVDEHLDNGITPTGVTVLPRGTHLRVR